MISEPELNSPYEDPHRAYRRPDGPGPEGPDAGDPDPDGSPGTEGPAGPQGAAPAGPGARGVRVRWAVGGALVSAALCLGYLAATGAGRDDRPELAYALPRDMCAAVPVPALERVTETKSWSQGSRTDDQDPALASGLCWRDKEIADRRRPWRSWNVRAVLELHRRTDPGPEFTARAATSRGLEHVTQEAVSGLGQRAVMIRTPTMEGLVLRVLDGGAVFELSVLTDATGEDPFAFSPDPLNLPEPDWTAVQAAMVEDMQAMLAATRQE